MPFIERKFSAERVSLTTLQCNDYEDLSYNSNDTPQLQLILCTLLYSVLSVPMQG